jgi:Tfp pilus assembly protein PilP
LSSEKVVCIAPPHENVQSVQEVRVQAAKIVHEIQVIELYTPPIHPSLQGDPYSSEKRYTGQDRRHWNPMFEAKNRSMLEGFFYSTVGRLRYVGLKCKRDS